MGRGRIELDITETGSGKVLTGDALAPLLEWSPRAGEAVTVVGPGGRLYRARVTALAEDRAELTVFEEAGEARVPPVDIMLLQAVPEKERMELIIEKATELGVGSVVPVKSEKSTTVDERDGAQKKSRLWDKRALKAAKQCRREDIPEVCREMKLTEVLSGGAVGADLRIMPYEGPGTVSLKSHMAGIDPEEIKEAAILTGPEGGFTEEEVERAGAAGFTLVSLGRRILRTETSAILAVGLLAYELGW